MKKIISLLLTLACLFSVGAMVSCGKDKTQLKVGFLNGPTGIGMAELIATNGGVDGNEKYAFTKFEDTNEAAAALQSGKLDVVCLPTNEAAKIYNNEEIGIDVQVLAINCLNSLYVVAKNDISINSFSDLEGKTVYTCKNGTPAIILNKLISEYGLNITVKTELGEGDAATVIAKPQDLPAVIVGGKADIVIAPEPIVTNALLKTSNYSVKLDLGEVWDAKYETPLAMGCVVARKDFVDEHKSVIDSFLEDYKSSIEYISNENNLDIASQYAVDTGIMAALPAAKKAIANLGDSIAYIDGAEMKKTLETVYNVFGMKVIGGKLPGDDFYYGGK